MEKAKQDYDTEIELLQKEKCHLDDCVENLTQEQTDVKSKLEIKQNEILELKAQLSALQCELYEREAQCKNLVNDYVDKFSMLTDKHQEEIEHMKNNFWKEKEKFIMENESCKDHASKMETKANEMEETNCSLMEELKNLQKYCEDVRKTLFICVKVYIILLCIPTYIILLFLSVYVYT